MFYDIELDISVVVYGDDVTVLTEESNIPLCGEQGSVID